jgi:hypothetical protein
MADEEKDSSVATETAPSNTDFQDVQEPVEPELPAEGADDAESYTGNPAAESKLDVDGNEITTEQVDEDPPEEKPATAKQEPEAVKADPKLDALIARARDLGLSDEDIGAFENGADLERSLRVYERRLMNSVATGQQIAPVAQPPVTQSATAQQLQAAVEEIPDLPGDQYDEGIVQAWGAMKSMVMQLREQNGRLYQGIQAQQQRESDARFDGFISKLGEEYLDLMGKGSVDELDPQSQVMQNRKEVRQAMYSLGIGLHKLGKKIPPEKVLFERALDSVFGSKTKEIERKRLASTLKKQSKQFIGRVTHREGVDSRTPQQRAIAAVQAKIKDRVEQEEADDF